MSARGHSRKSTNAAVNEAANMLFDDGGLLDFADPISLGEKIEEKVSPVVEKATALVETAKETVQSNILPALGRVVEKAVPTALAASASLQYMGSQGSYLDFIRPAYLSSYFMPIDDDRSEFIGYPLHQIVTLNTLSGFVLCENVKLAIPDATIEEIQLIQQALESGCYIE